MENNQEDKQKTESNEKTPTLTLENISLTSSQEQNFLLYTKFQEIMEKANELFNQEDKSKKEKAITVLNTLLNSTFVTDFKSSNKIIHSCLCGIINYYIAIFKLYKEDPLVSEPSFTKSLEYFNTLPTLIKMRYVNYFQDIFNNLGIIYYNKGEISKGLQHFAKAEQLYKVFLNLPKNENEKFTFYIDGGLNKKNFEHNYTLTVFYYAQAFTKLDFRKKAINYCSMTVKRQIEHNEYDLKDALVNCINLSDFYIENKNYAQTEYILQSALSLLPKDLELHKELRASVQKQLGKYYLERLKFAVILHKENKKISEDENLKKILNEKKFIFENLNIAFPEIKDVNNLEEAKSLFRLGNTQFKKALKFFIMDGYVTDNILINQSISHLYKYLILFENDNGRIFAMEERRINLLEPIFNAINHKVYVIQWQETSLELAEIFCEIFESKYELVQLKNKKINQSEIEEINEFGKKSIFYYNDIIEYIVTEYGKEKEKRYDDFITIITIKSNIARLYSKLIFLDDVKKRVEALKTSLNIYTEVNKFLKESKKIFGDKKELQVNLEMSEEMIGMLPIKIDKVNRGEEFL